MPRRTAKRQPVNVKTLALGLPNSAFHRISWREGTNERLTGIERDLPRGAPPAKVDVARLVELTTQTTPTAVTH